MRDIIGSSLVRDSFDELLYNVLVDFDHPDFVCNPRGSEVKEIILPRLCLSSPRSRLLTNIKRKANYGFAVGEFLWYWRGSNSLEDISYYNKRMSGFSDDGLTINSAYGYIVKGKAAENQINNRTLIVSHVNSALIYDQWSICVNTLKNDSDSRRAILQIHQPVHQWHANENGSKDVPCTLSLQFFIRENKLHCHAHMRSNDVHWGLTYDLFSFTLFQECMLLELKEYYPKLELGRYFHTAGSLHIYSHHYDLTKEMINEYRRMLTTWRKDWDKTRFIEPMDPLESIDDINNLMVFEKQLREGNTVEKHNFTGTVGWMADQLLEHKIKRNKEKK